MFIRLLSIFHQDYCSHLPLPLSSMVYFEQSCQSDPFKTNVRLCLSLLKTPRWLFYVIQSENSSPPTYKAPCSATLLTSHYFFDFIFSCSAPHSLHSSHMKWDGLYGHPHTVYLLIHLLHSVCPPNRMEAPRGRRLFSPLLYPPHLE